MGIVYDFVTFATGLRGIPGVPFGQFFAVWAAVIEAGVLVARADCDGGRAACLWVKQTHDDIARIKGFRNDIENGLAIVGVTVPSVVWATLEQLQDAIDTGAASCASSSSSSTRKPVPTINLNCYRAVVGVSMFAAGTGNDPYSAAQQQRYVAPCAQWVGPTPYPQRSIDALAEAAFKGDKSAQRFFKYDSKLKMHVFKFGQTLAGILGSGVDKSTATKQQVSDVWRAVLAPMKLDEETLKSLGLLPPDPANRVQVKGGGSNFLRNLLIGTGVVGGIGAVAYVATRKKRKAS